VALPGLPRPFWNIANEAKPTALTTWIMTRCLLATKLASFTGSTATVIARDGTGVMEVSVGWIEEDGAWKALRAELSVPRK